MAVTRLCVCPYNLMDAKRLAGKPHQPIVINHASRCHAHLRRAS